MGQGASGDAFRKPFSKWEIDILKSTYEDLASRSKDKKTIGQETFLKLFSSVGGMLGVRLFHVFDQDKSGDVDFDEFVEGIRRYARGSRTDKLGFIFQMFDLGGMGRVSEANLDTMLNSLFPSFPSAAAGDSGIRTVSFLNSSDSDSDDEMDSELELLGSTPHRSRRMLSQNSPGTGINRSASPQGRHKSRQHDRQESGVDIPVMVNSRVQPLIQRAMELANESNSSGPRKDFLTSYDFARWMDECPEVMDALDQSFSSVSATSGSNPRPYHSGGTVGERLSLASVLEPQAIPTIADSEALMNLKWDSRKSGKNQGLFPSRPQTSGTNGSTGDSQWGSSSSGTSGGGFWARNSNPLMKHLKHLKHPSQSGGMSISASAHPSQTQGKHHPGLDIGDDYSAGHSQESVSIQCQNCGELVLRYCYACGNRLHIHVQVDHHSEESLQGTSQRELALSGGAPAAINPPQGLAQHKRGARSLRGSRDFSGSGNWGRQLPSNSISGNESVLLDSSSRSSAAATQQRKMSMASSHGGSLLGPHYSGRLSGDLVEEEPETHTARPFHQDSQPLELECLDCGPVFMGDGLRFCFSCGYPVSLLTPAPTASLPSGGRPRRGVSHSSTGSMSGGSTGGLPEYQTGPGGVELIKEGYLSKVGARFKTLKQRWFVIKDNFFYSFSKRSALKPQHVCFLQGCFIEPVNHSDRSSKLEFGLELITSENPRQSKFYYAKTLKERDSWVASLRASANMLDVEDYYVIGKEIGIGRFSTVHIASSKSSGRKYAIKIIDKMALSTQEREALHTEIAIMKLVHHPCVIRLKSVFENRRKIFILMTLVAGGDLYDRIRRKKRLPEGVAQLLLRRILSVVQYLHQRGIVHRDLKPENIYLKGHHNDHDIMIGDFGLSKFCSPDELMTVACGTMTYMAPEIFDASEKGSKGYTHQVDMWSVGIIMYLVLSGSLPFANKDDSDQDIVRKTKEGILDFSDPLWKKITPEAEDLIRRLLEVSPDERITADESLRHPWFSKVFPIPPGEPHPDLGDATAPQAWTRSAAPASPEESVPSSPPDSPPDKPGASSSGPASEEDPSAEVPSQQPFPGQQERPQDALEAPHRPRVPVEEFKTSGPISSFPRAVPHPHSGFPEFPGNRPLTHSQSQIHKPDPSRRPRLMRKRLSTSASVPVLPPSIMHQRIHPPQYVQEPQYHHQHPASPPHAAQPHQLPPPLFQTPRSAKPPPLPASLIASPNLSHKQEL